MIPDPQLPIAKPRSQVGLWHLFAWITVFAVAFGLIKAAVSYDTLSIWMCAVGVRLLLLAVVAPTVGLLTGRHLRALLTAISAIVLLDVIWFLLICGLLRRITAEIIATDLLLISVPVLCHAATLKSHRQGLLYGISVAGVLSTVIALAILFISDHSLGFPIACISAAVVFLANVGPLIAIRGVIAMGEHADRSHPGIDQQFG